MRIRNRKNERGSVTVEATIALTAFLFLFVMIYGLITICRAQANIQIAINSAAREISQFSYLYGMTGLDKSMNAVREKANKNKTTAGEFIDNVKDVFGEIKGLVGEAKEIDTTDWQSIAGGVKNLVVDGKVVAESDSVKEIWSSLKAAASDPKAVLFGLGRIMAADGWDTAASTLIAAPISRMITQRYLRRSATDTAEAFCKSVGVVPGSFLGEESYFNGLDFTHSQLFPLDTETGKATDEILIVVTYKVKLLQLLPLPSEFSITQVAQTRGWMHGDGGSLK